MVVKSSSVDVAYVSLFLLLMVFSRKITQVVLKSQIAQQRLYEANITYIAKQFVILLFSYVQCK